MVILTLTTTLMLLTPAHAQDDNRANVSVKTKRPSIGSRSLPRLAEIAVDHSPVIQQAKNTLDVADLELRNARVTFLPSLDFRTTYGLQDASPTQKDISIRSPYHSDFDLRLTENLYDNGANFTKLKLAETKLDRARLDFEYQRDLQLTAVAQAYYDWSAIVRQREIDENNLDLLRRQYKILEAQYKQGLKTKRDVLRIETEMRRVDMDVVHRDNDVDQAFQKLASVVGISRQALDKEDIENEEAKPFAVREVNASELKVSDHRRMRILDYDVQVLDIGARLAKLEYGPRVELSGGMGLAASDYWQTGQTIDDRKVLDWSALVTLKYNLFDFGTRRRNVEIANVKTRNVTDVNRQIRLDLANDLRDIWNRLREGQENMRMSRDLLTIEQQSYSILEAEYRNGRASYLDLITNLRSLIDARSRFASSYFNLRKQQTLYSFHKGDLRDALLP